MESPLHFLTIVNLLLLLTSSSSSYTHLAITASTKPDNFTDLEALLSFQAHIDPHGFLTTNWTTNTSFCSWVGVHCSRRRQRVTAIKLYDLPLQGTISSQLGNLSFLSQLILSNNSLTGPIPQSIGDLPRLSYVVLQRNSLTGLIPSNIFNMSSLLYLYVGGNNLMGSLPLNDSFTMPPRLKVISLGENHLTGDVLSSFLQCLDIQKISLAGNQFSGTIPVEMGSLSELRILYLGTNKLTGSIPSSLGNLSMLTGLSLGGNNFSGIVPDKLGNLVNLQSLNLAANANIIGSIPISLLNMSKLRELYLNANKLTGSVPAGIGRSMPMLESFTVADNQLSGGLDFISSLSNCKNLEHLEMYKNLLDGIFPDDVGNLSTNLLYFTAFGNRIKGNIPRAIGNLSGLISLSLKDNELTGTIPSTIARLQSLQYMGLSFNNISGWVPFELGLIQKLSYLYLDYNKLFGPIPKSLANISMLQYLHLANNKFSTNIPESLWTSSSLLEVDLSKNNLNGLLPPQVSNLKALAILDLSLNMLSGNITDDLGELSTLTYMDLSKNSFQGQIPESFGGLVSITYLNLSSNFLSGVIPNSLANLSHLDSVDLSFNKLEGQVPKGRAFLNSSISSLIGNTALCGAPQLHISPCFHLIKNDSRKKILPFKYALLVSIFGVLLLSFFCLIYIFYSRRKLKSLPETNVTRLDYHRAISHYELVRATENFSEANLIGRGGFGSVFKGCLDDQLVVAVKVMNLENEESSKSFDAECQVLKTVRHKNLVKIISVCSNLDFKALVLEYMPNGNLEHWLYSDNCFLNLNQRLNVMVDVSLAVEYLHHHCPQIVLHCDLKPTNILLDEELVAHVSDFGISKLLFCDSRSIATTSVLGTTGYIAPEYAITGAISRMGDVYSFGILLLETFTRIKPVDSMFDGQLSLREWICKAYPNKILDVVDGNILRNNDVNDILPKLHRCVSSVIELGLLCSCYLPKERIPMTKVTARLQKIKMEYLSI